MKKTSKKAVKPAKKAAKPAVSGKKAPEYKSVKALVKAVLAGEKPRGLKVEINHGTKIATLSYGSKDHRAGFPYDADAMLVDVCSALGIKVVESDTLPKGL